MRFCVAMNVLRTGVRGAARLRLQLCRDAARVAAHRGGHDSRVMQKILLDATTKTMDFFSIDTDDEDVGREDRHREPTGTTCTANPDRARGAHTCRHI